MAINEIESFGVRSRRQGLNKFVIINHELQLSSSWFGLINHHWGTEAVGQAKSQVVTAIATATATATIAAASAQVSAGDLRKR